MSKPRRAGRTRLRWGYLPLMAALGAAVAILPATAGSAAVPTISASEGAYGYGFSWSPPSAEVSAGGAVEFRNGSEAIPHGVTWSGAPAAPTCTGVPIGEGKTKWSGSCTFTQPGTYSFYCPVHPTEMKGTVTVTASGTTITTTTTTESQSTTTTTTSAPPPPGGQEGGSPLAGSPGTAIRVPARQHGHVVRGSLALTASASGRLAVELLAPGSRGGSSAARRVGRLLGSLHGGRLQFAVPLDRAGRAALRRHHRLPLTVHITLTPAEGRSVSAVRHVVLRG